MVTQYEVGVQVFIAHHGGSYELYQAKCTCDNGARILLHSLPLKSLSHSNHLSVSILSEHNLSIHCSLGCSNHFPIYPEKLNVYRREHGLMPSAKKLLVQTLLNE
jgi:hypothetical protein